jgi:hypothetical protein
MIIGYIKVISASGRNATPLFNVSLKDLKSYTLTLAEAQLSTNFVANQV